MKVTLESFLASMATATNATGGGSDLFSFDADFFLTMPELAHDFEVGCFGMRESNED
jgi:hypothetical protein